MDPKSKFYKTYANLPLGLRNEIIAVLDNEPVTWNAVKIEIENDTPKGKILLEKLLKLKIISIND